MFDEVLFGNTKKYLALLAEKEILPNQAYLAGGTAIALQLGHRISYDLDFFTPSQFQLEEILYKLKTLKEFKLDRTAWGTILGSFSDCKFSIFYYPYPLVEKPSRYLGLNVARAKDLAASKIGAISSRGTKRDFIDLYYLLQSGKVGNLEKCLTFYEKRFGNLSAMRFHILKSLTYFEDADQEKDPKMLVKDYSWREIKKYFSAEVKKLVETRKGF